MIITRLKRVATPDITREISDATLINWRDSGSTGLAVGPLRRWHRQGRVLPLGRTIGGHRSYKRDTVRAALGAEPAATGKTVCYARVSPHDQAV